MKLHILETASQFSDSIRKFEADVDLNLDRGADFVGMTETGENRHKALARVAKKHDYQLIHPLFPNTKRFANRKGEHTNGPLLLRKDHKLLKSGWIPCIPPKDAPPSKGGHDWRGWTWMRAEINGLTVFALQGHLLRYGREGEPNQDPAAVRANQAMIQKGADRVAKEADGVAVAFMLMDSNTPDKQLHVPGMTSIWEERKWPASPIVTILSADKDKRVEGTRVRRWPLENSDHAALSAYYTIREGAE